MDKNGFVAILLLMEKTFLQQGLTNYKKVEMSRNPSFNGKDIPTIICEDEMWILKQVAILLLMEKTFLHLQRKLFRLAQTAGRNPSFNAKDIPTNYCFTTKIIYITVAILILMDKTFLL